MKQKLIFHSNENGYLLSIILLKREAISYDSYI